MSLASEFEEKVFAGVSGILVTSHEHGDAFHAIYQHCRDQGWPCGSFDHNVGCQYYTANAQGEMRAVRGWFEPGPSGAYAPKELPEKFINAEFAVRHALGLRTLASPEATAKWGGTVPCVLLIKNPEFWFGQPGFVQTVADCLYANRSLNVHLVFLTTTASLPPQLQRLFEAGQIQHELPDRAQIARVLSRVDGVAETPFAHDEAFREKVLDAAAGLTRLGVEDAAALSLVRRQALDPEVMFDLKARAFANGLPGLELYRGRETFATYGGAPFLKEFALKLLAHRSADPRHRPRGIFLVGPPGTGKTLFAKCLGNAVGRPTAVVKLGAMKSSLQGRSFSNLRNVLQVLEAISPAIAFFDEVEGQVSGGKSTGSLDAGTSSQMNSELLSWLSEHTADTFTLASCNSVTTLMAEMPEFARMGRFDGLFFLDYPREEAKVEIWKIHLATYGFIEAGTATDLEEQFRKIKLPKTDNWTGAEIEACCRIASLLGKSVAEFGKHMPTIAQQAGDQIEEIRRWAEGRCWAAEYEGVYHRDEHDARIAAALSAGDRRRLPKPSNN